jgi:hypothetical protein
MLRRTISPAYLFFQVNELPRLVRVGRLPTPSHHLGPKSPRWDWLALDALFAGGVASTDPETVVQGIVQEILQGGALRRR